MTPVDRDADPDWPVDLRGVTETVVTTLGPNDRWNVAALGVHAGDPATARTYGRTRTWRNFRERGEGYVQFTRDPVDFVEAALAVREVDDPLLASADAWARVEVSKAGATKDGATEEGTGEEVTGGASDAGATRVVTWELAPVETGVERETVPTTNRGYGAVVEASVAASRLDVPAYDTADLLDRLAYFEDVVERCGGPRERAAFDRIGALTDAEW